MGTLTSCMTSLGLSDREKGILKQAAEENRSINGDQGPMGAYRAAADYFMEIEGERNALAEQIAKQGGEAPQAAYRFADLAKSMEAFKPLAPAEEVVRFSRLATRVPTAKGVQFDPEDVQIADYPTLKTTPEAMEKSVAALMNEPGFDSLEGDTTEEKAESAISRIKDNVLWLYNQVPENIRERSRKWYDGASEVAKNWADQYKITKSQAAGIIATLSPQKDWFMNVTMAERVMDVVSSKMDYQFDKKMKGTAFNFLVKDMGREMRGEKRENLAAFKRVQDKTLREVIESGDMLGAGIWIRAYDEANNSPAHAIVSPEGGFGENVQNAQGEDALRAWGGFENIGKAASIYLDGSAKNISKNLGREHKVRNFYNNIFAPEDPRFVTIDTHAVAAGLLRPLAGTSKPVTENFGAAGQSASTGISGTYPLYHEAYLRAAKEVGVLPREMQSITWEAVRGLFPEELKSQAGKEVKAEGVSRFDMIWQEVGRGEITPQQAQARILEMAGGIGAPDWFVEGQDIPILNAKSYKQEKPPFAGTKIAFEVAPDPNNVELTERWNKLPEDDKSKISFDIAFETAGSVLGYYNRDTIKGELRTQMGGYLDNTNPSFSIQMNKYASMSKIKEIARVLGSVLRQDSMVIVSPKQFKGSFQMGVVGLDNVSEAQAAEVYNDLRANIRAADGSALINGHTTSEGGMLILVDKGTEREIAERVGQYVGDKHGVWDGDTWVEWPEKGDDDYGIQGNDEVDSGGIPEASLGRFRDQLRAQTDEKFGNALAAAEGRAALPGNREGEGRGAEGRDDAAEGSESEVSRNFRGKEAVGGEAFLTAPMSRMAAQIAVDDISEGWKGGSPIEVVDSPREFPVDAPEDARGVFYKNKVWVAAGNHTSPKEVARTVLHEEFGHAGMRGILGKDIDPVMRNIYLTNRRVSQQANDLIKSFREMDGTEMGIEEAAEEVLADMAGDGKIKELKGWDKLVAKVKSWLRAHGFNFDWSDDDVMDLLSRSKRLIEEGGEKKESQGARNARPVPGQAQPTWDAPEPSRLDNLIYLLQDKNIDTKRVTAAIKEARGGVSDKLDPRLQETLVHGRIDKKVGDFLGKELRPLVQEMELRKVSNEELHEFLKMRHAEEYNDQIAKINTQFPDAGSGVKTKDARKYLAGLSPEKRKAFDALAQRVDAIIRETQDILVDSGLETQDTIDAWNATYQFYVPFNREDVEEGMGTGQGFNVRGPASKRAMGSSKEISDILANVALQRERAVMRAEKNRVATALVGLAMMNPKPGFWQVDTVPKIRAVENRQGQDQVVERPDPSFRQKDNVLHARINGQDHFVIFNEGNERALRMARSLKNLDVGQMGQVLGAFSKATRWFAAINTQYNPVFGATNFIRDFQTGMLNLTSTEIAGEQNRVRHYAIDALRGGLFATIKAERRGKQANTAWAPWWEEFQQAGGKVGFTQMFSTTEERAGAIQKEIKNINRHPTLKIGGAVMDWLSNYNETAENAVRLAAYRVAREKGMTQERAAALAKELTVNFNRRGQVAQQANALYAFFNASVQGQARIAETLRGKQGMKIMAGGMLLGVMQAVMLAWAGMGGEDGPPEFVKERNLIIPAFTRAEREKGTYVTIPMPLGYHVLVNLGRIPAEMVMGGWKNKFEHAADLFNVFIDAFNPVGSATLAQTLTPTVVDPVVALGENKDWTGKPIYREDFSKTHPTPGFTRAMDTASPWSKAIAEFLNYATGGTKYTPGGISPTPDQIDYLISQATGGVGRESKKAVETVASEFSGEELPIHKVPFAGRFIGSTQGQSAEGSRFYENLKKLNVHQEQIDGLTGEGKRAEALEYLQDHPEARLAKLGDTVEREVQKLRKERRKAMEAGQKDRVKLIEQAITTKMTGFNERVRQMGELAESE